MPTFLSDPPSKLYIILGFVTALLGAIWFLKRTRGPLLGAIGAGLVLLAFFLCDKFFESPREEASRKIVEISAATKARKLDDAFKHVSESFQYHGMDKKGLHEKAKWAESFQMWNGIDVSDLDRTDWKMLDDNRVQIGFDMWPAGYGLPQYRFHAKATFQKDPDGQFRLQALEFRPNRDPASAIVYPDDNRP
jgi:hypothetical protein